MATTVEEETSVRLRILYDYYIGIFERMQDRVSALKAQNANLNNARSRNRYWPWRIAVGLRQLGRLESIDILR